MQLQSEKNHDLRALGQACFPYRKYTDVVINKEKTFQTLKLDLYLTDEIYDFRLFLMNSLVKSEV